MSNKKEVQLRYIALVLLAAVLCFKRSESQSFDQLYTGVTFSPYVKIMNDNNVQSYQSSYTVQDIRTMLEVIVERFSKVVTFTVGSKNETYIRNNTYYTGSYIEVNIAEMAARLNRDRRNTSINLIQGIWQQDALKMHTETLLALECAEKANNIYPGTVEGFLFSHDTVKSGLTDEQLLNFMKMAKESRVGRNLKVGIWMFCGNPYRGSIAKILKDGVFPIIQKIFQHADFVLCHFYPQNVIREIGAEAAFESVGEWMLEFREQLRNLSTTEVMCQLSWDSDGNNKWQNLQNLKTYWEVANEWAKQNEFPVYFLEAFDNPGYESVPCRNCVPSSQHSGWWRLTNNSKIGEREGYIEKISVLEIPDQNSTVTANTTTVVSPPTITSSNVVISIAVGLPVVIFFLSLVTFLLFRVKKLNQKLSSNDILTFMHGTSDSFEDGHNTTSSGHDIPYDTLYEISLNQLEICIYVTHLWQDYDQILGMGHFGCVFMATLTHQMGTSLPVALKVAREDCSRSTLKGLLSEIKVMMYIGRHPNIVELIGAYTAELHRDVVYIATELCGLGSLESFLRKREISVKYLNVCPQQDAAQEGSTNTIAIEPITFLQMLQWSQEIAAGMEFLMTKKVVHADLATRNVLLNEEKVAKISDFGLSRRMYNYANYVKTSQEPLPWRWMAIESLNRNEFSSKSDVWSFGVTMWEIFNKGNMPYAGLSWTTQFVGMLERGMRLKRPTLATPELYEIMVCCWHTEPSERPSFSDICEMVLDVTKMHSDLL